MKPTLEDAFKEIEQYPLSHEFYDSAVSIVKDAHDQAVQKFPTWPVNAFVGQTIIGEEVGEAEQAALDIPFDLKTGNAKVDDLIIEHAQSAAMHKRQIQHILFCQFNSRLKS